MVRQADSDMSHVERPLFQADDLRRRDSCVVFCLGGTRPRPARVRSPLTSNRRCRNSPGLYSYTHQEDSGVSMAGGEQQGGSVVSSPDDQEGCEEDASL